MDSGWYEACFKTVNDVETEMFPTEPEELTVKTLFKRIIPLAAAIVLLAGTVLLNGSVMGSGTAYYTGASSSWNFTNEPASSLATPISGSVWLLLSGGFAVIGVRRKLTQPN
jgi:hypothetical protein